MSCKLKTLPTKEVSHNDIKMSNIKPGKADTTTGL